MYSSVDTAFDGKNYVPLGCPFFRRPQPGHKRLKKKTALVFPHAEMPFSPWKLAKKDPILEIIGKGVKTIGKCLFWLPKNISRW